jgi:integration host factor subunit alpha
MNFIWGEDRRMALTKAQIIEKIAENNGFTKNKGAEIVDTLLELMKRAMAKGEDVMISGFGKFCVKEKAERKGRNPATGSAMLLRPRKVVTFKCSGKLRSKINGKPTR